MPDTFQSFIEKERRRLARAREEAQERLKAAQEELAAIDCEEKAIEAYERVKQGLPQGRGGQRATSSLGDRKRAPRGERSSQILEVIRTNPGIDTSGICEKLGVMDEKGIASVSTRHSRPRRLGTKKWSTTSVHRFARPHHGPTASSAVPIYL